MQMQSIEFSKLSIMKTSLIDNCFKKTISKKRKLQFYVNSNKKYFDLNNATEQIPSYSLLIIALFLQIFCTQNKFYINILF